MSRFELESKAYELSISNMELLYEYSHDEIKEMIMAADNETLENYIEECEE